MTDAELKMAQESSMRGTTEYGAVANALSADNPQRHALMLLAELSALQVFVLEVARRLPPPSAAND